ncbi:MAG: hypothetical protein O7I93_01770 [Gemmatimonadetes bacterium]|nr:hypothetical protein [Gemmatimonadota bacterium]
MKLRNYFLAGLVCLASAPAAVAQDDENVRWTPDLSMQYDVIQGVSMSRDGQYIAYVLGKPIMEDTNSNRILMWFNRHLRRAVPTTDHDRE